MRRLRTHTAKLWLLLGLLSWVSGVSAQFVHEVVVQHIRCADHGQLVEVESHGDQSAVADLDSSPDDDQHDHGCDYDLLLVAAPPTLLSLPAADLTSWRPDQQPPQLGAPRGPPLAYAPKTSPPTIS